MGPVDRALCRDESELSGGGVRWGLVIGLTLSLSGIRGLG